MIRLIVNADDLGAGAATDRGILHAFRRGMVGSASLLANGPSFAEAARAALGEGVPIGAHLNLAEGVPLAGSIPGLTTASGEFPGKEVCRQRLVTGRIAPGALARELSAQLSRIVDAGLSPDHLDTHQHCALFPAVTAALLQVAGEFGIPALRLPAPAEPMADDPGGELGQELLLYRSLAPPFDTAVRRAGLATPDGLWGMALLDRLDEPALEQLLLRLPTGTWELMVHPGYADPGRPFATAARERELAALTSPRLRGLLTARQITLITFQELACAS
ncbi:MAG: ChbG/HpnK family deacetylase [Desulfuromonadales bacterium]|nr:ChbG/HpnK family deacetylase [Desulfuromonadales bacterium]